jgi:hypothetical protein
MISTSYEKRNGEIEGVTNCKIKNYKFQIEMEVSSLMVHFRKFCCQNLRLEMVTCQKFATSVYSFEMKIPPDLKNFPTFRLEKLQAPNC